MVFNFNFLSIPCHDRVRVTESKHIEIHDFQNLIDQRKRAFLRCEPNQTKIPQWSSRRRRQGMLLKFVGVNKTSHYFLLS